MTHFFSVTVTEYIYFVIKQLVTPQQCIYITHETLATMDHYVRVTKCVNTMLHKYVFTSYLFYDCDQKGQTTVC